MSKKIDKLHMLPARSDLNIRTKFTLYCEALCECFNFWTDALDCKKSFSRQRVDKSFNEVINICCADKAAHWTILWRDKVFEDDIPHWEFGVNSKGDVNYFIWIKVSDEEAQKLFKEYDLIVKES